MTDDKDETGKGAPRPGDSGGAKRPYATIDLKATEVAAADAAATDKPASDQAAKPPDASAAPAEPGWDVPGKEGVGPSAQAGDGGSDTGTPRVDDAQVPAGGRAWSSPFLTHLGAGALGALIVSLLGYLLAPDHPPARGPDAADLARRVAEVETALGMRPGSAGLRGRLDELGRTVGALGDAQTKLTREAKALETMVGSGSELPKDLTARLGKLEQALAALSSGAQAGQPPQITALMGRRLAELDKAAREVGEAAKAGSARVDGELAAVRTEAGRVGQRIDGLKGEVDERFKAAAKAADVSSLTAKLTSLEQDVRGVAKSEADRNTSASRIVLALELANLKRAMDRGEGYASELAAVQKIGGYTMNLSALERYQHDGVVPVTELAKSFRKVANAMVDADAEPANAGLWERLLSGARSIVRVRKSGHAADDTGTEAVVGRMETALKEGRLADVLASAKQLPAKAALAGEDWIRKVQARHAVNQALAEAEASLKTALGGPRAAGTEPKR